MKNLINREEYISKFFPLVLKYAPKYNSFSVFSLHEIIPLEEYEIRIFKNIDFDIKLYLVDNNYAIIKGSSDIKLTEKGLNYFNDIEEKKLNDNISKLTYEKLKFEQIPAKFWWLIIIITAFISILTTWINNQISKSENKQEIQKREIVLPK